MANAGQNPPLVRRASGEIEVLTKAGSELGVFDELEISNKTITLASLDEVVLYTDGVTEAYHPQRNEEYGIDRLYVYQSLSDVSSCVRGLLDWHHQFCFTVDTTSDFEIKGYARAIREYSENLDRVWD